MDWINLPGFDGKFKRFSFEEIIEMFGFAHALKMYFEIEFSLYVRSQTEQKQKKSVPHKCSLF